MGITSAMYTHDIGPHETDDELVSEIGISDVPSSLREKMTVTQNKKKTTAIESPFCGFSVSIWLLTMASQIKAIVIPIVPHRRGLRRPTRSMMKMMKMRSGIIKFAQVDEDSGMGKYTCKRSHAVVNPGYKQISMSNNTQRLVHASLVVSNDIWMV
jgi:hypothetical protein